MTTVQPQSRAGPRLFYLAVLAGFALLYALAFFQGLEQHGAYPGNSFKAIHPESFPGDRFITGRQPTILSLVYVIAHAVGDLWLDDRFQFVWYLGLAFLGIVAVDRLAKLFGIEGRLERLAVIALLLVAHHFKPSVFGQFIPSSGSPTAVIHPLGLWLTVLLLQGNRAVAALGLSALMGLIAAKNGWYPALMALLFSLRDRWRVPWRRIAAWVALCLGLVFLVHFLVHLGSREPALLFDWINWYEDGEGNPFREFGVGNYFYLVLLVCPMLVPYRSVELQQRCRAFFIIALITLIGSGFYYTFAPDALKIPLIQALSVNRTSWWPQQLSYIILGCFTVKLFDRGPRRAKVLAAALLGLLYLMPFFEVGTVRLSDFFIKRAALLLAVWAGLGMALLMARRVGRALNAKAALLLLPIVLTTAVYLARCAHTQGPHLRFLLSHGVMGNSTSAQWAGVDTYMRTQTAADTSVLVLVVEDQDDTRLHVDWTLRVRTGRTMPVGHRTISYLNAEKASWYFEQLQLWRALGKSWVQHDWAGVSRSLSIMDSPDYLVVPTDQTGWLRTVNEVNYEVETVIGDFTILRRADAGAVHAASPVRQS